MSRKRALLSVLTVIEVCALAYVITHPTQMRHVARRVYVAGWRMLPTLDGVDMPDRFADPK